MKKRIRNNANKHGIQNKMSACTLPVDYNRTRRAKKFYSDKGNQDRLNWAEIMRALTFIHVHTQTRRAQHTSFIIHWTGCSSLHSPVCIQCCKNKYVSVVLINFKQTYIFIYLSWISLHIFISQGVSIHRKRLQRRL